MDGYSLALNAEGKADRVMLRNDVADDDVLIVDVLSLESVFGIRIVELI